MIVNCQRTIEMRMKYILLPIIFRQLLIFRINKIELKQKLMFSKMKMNKVMYFNMTKR